MRTTALLLALILCTAVFAAPSYHVIKKIPLGGEGGWDYLTVDSAANRLYISRGTHVMVLDTVTDKLVGDIPDTAGVHGIAIAPELGRGFTSNGRANTSTIFDLNTLKPLGTVNTGENPDCILYEPRTQRVFTFNGRSNDATAFNATTGEVLATIPLGGKPEFAQADGRGNVFVNVEDTNQLFEIDARTLEAGKPWSLKPGDSPTGMGLDARRHRVFSVCGNQLMTILDARKGAMLTTLPIGKGADGAGFDPGLGYAFSSNGGDGTLTVVQETSRGKFAVVQTAKTQRGARTMAVDPATHKVYVVTAKFGPMPAGAVAGPRQRPPMVKDSFMVLVVGE